MTTPPLTDKEKEESELIDQALTNLELEHETINVWENGSSNGHSNNNKPDKQTKHEYMTFKYSSRFRGTLHEAILLNGKPVFIKYENGQVQVVPKIEEEGRVLRPPSIEEYPYEPIEFESYEEIKKYQAIVLREVTKGILFQKIFETVSLYIDQDEDIRILISADILWTYFQDLFPTTHYYDISGTGNGIGKSTIGHVFEGIAYRAVKMTDPSAANLYRILGKIEPGQRIIIADEADRIHTDRDMMSILKEGYTILGKVSKINKNTEKQKFFFSYCFKIRIAEEPMRPSFAKGVIDRSFMIKAIKGIPSYDIKEVLHPAARNEILEKLHNNLRSLRKLLLIYRLVHFDDPIIDAEIDLNGRDKELCKPLLQLFYDTTSYGKIAKAIKTFLVKKNNRKKNVSIEPVLYGIIVDMIPRYGTTISVANIWDEIKNKIGGVYDEKKPNEYQTFDYDTIYKSTITKIIEGFGAEREHRRTGNVMIFEKDKLVKAGRMYELGEGGEGGEGNNDTIQNNDILNIVKVDRVHRMPSLSSPLHHCSYCEILGRGKVEFSSEDLLERHSIQKHPGRAIYSKLDIEKFKEEQSRKK
jgi:hypothetical protein